MIYAYQHVMFSKPLQQQYRSLMKSTDTSLVAKQSNMFNMCQHVRMYNQRPLICSFNTMNELVAIFHYSPCARYNNNGNIFYADSNAWRSLFSPKYNNSMLLTCFYISLSLSLEHQYVKGGVNRIT